MDNGRKSFTEQTGGRCRHICRRRAFTLVETLLVIVIVGILAAIVVPMFNESVDDAKDAVLRQNLQAVRSAFERFKLDHNGQLPGFTNLADTGDHLTKYTDARGQISDVPSPAFPYGPYLPQQNLINPINGGYGVELSADPANATPNNNLVNGDGEPVGWWLDLVHGRISANAEGVTSDGTPRVRL